MRSYKGLGSEKIHSLSILGYNRRMAYSAEDRKKVVQLLGGRCQSPDCKWVNEDGSRGCADVRCLQVDHRHGGGNEHRRKAGGTMYSQMLRDPDLKEKYQLLCANCNWIKRRLNNEACPWGGRHERRKIDGQWQIKMGELWVPFTPPPSGKKRTRKDTVIHQDQLDAVIEK